MSQVQKFIPRRSKCDNCDGPYIQVKEIHRFCKPACRAEFHRNGGSFRKVVDAISKKLPAMIQQAVKAELAGVRRELNADIREEVRAVIGGRKPPGHQPARPHAVAAGG